MATPGLAGVQRRRAPGTVRPDTVVAAALSALGRRPRVVPGTFMRLSAQVMSRLLPRRTAITVFGRAAREVTGPT